MNFELIDNFFQVIALGISGLGAGILAVRYRERRFVFLAFAYFCFMMGTFYYVLHLAILKDIPHLSYAPEILWLASYLFYLSFQLLRMRRITIRFSPIAAIYSVLIIEEIFRWHIFGPLFLSTLAFAVTVGILSYLSFFRLLQKKPFCSIDLCLLLCTYLQVALYIVSAFMLDFTHFNLYFAVDFTLTGLFILLLPLTLREVKGR